MQWMENLLLERAWSPRARGCFTAGAFTVAVIAIVALATCAAGCATARDFAQGVVSSGGVVLDEADVIAAEAYRDRATVALEESQTLAEYRTAMEPYDEIVLALEGAQSVLLALQSLVNAWEAGGRADWPEVARAALEAFERVFRAMRIAGVSPPDSLFTFLGSTVELPED